MKKEKNWRIIITRRNYEQKLVKTFMRRGVQSFCPHCTFTSPHDGHTLSEKKPLFASMLFLYIDDQEMKTVINTRGVINFLYWMNSPAIIPHRDISHIYNFVNSFSNIQIEKCEVMVDIIPGDPVIAEDEKAGIVSVQLNSIGYRMVTKKENLYLKGHRLPVIRELYKLPAFSLNNSLNLASV